MRRANATIGAFVTLLGGTNVQASAPEAREVLERGVADKIAFTLGSLVLFGMDEVTKYHADMRIVTDYTFGVIPMFLPMGGFGGSRATTSCKRCCKPPARRRRCSRCRSGRSCSVTS